MKASNVERNESLEMGSATVPVAPVSVSLAGPRRTNYEPNGASFQRGEVSGETPKTAGETPRAPKQAEPFKVGGSMFDVWRSFALRWCLLCVLVSAIPTEAQVIYEPYTFTTIAGAPLVSTSLDGSGSTARFRNPQGVAMDSAGNVYVADTGSHIIRKITPAGVVSTLAGLAGISGSDDGLGNVARFNAPAGVAVDSFGNVYVADTSNHTIRKITPAGVVSTLAGMAGNPGGTDGSGSASRFSNPSSVAVDGVGNVYVADLGNSTIRKITPAGVVSTLAGQAGSPGSANGAGSDARFSAPSGVAVDTAGNVYVADKNNHVVRRISSGGVASTLAGQAGSSGSMDGTDGAARFREPSSVAVDSAGNVYVADRYYSTIRKITSTAVVSTLAGVVGGPGSTDGPGSVARLNQPVGVAVDRFGNTYAADTDNHTIRKITPTGEVSTLAGRVGEAGSANGTGGEARFNRPCGVAVDSMGNVYVADLINHAIRQITPAGEVSTFAGGITVPGSADGIGGAARFYNPWGVAVDSLNNVYVADSQNNKIRKITPAGEVSTLAGEGAASFADGPGDEAWFNNPTGVAVDHEGNVYVADQINAVIRKITPAGVVSTLSGVVASSGIQDGFGGNVRFASPTGIAVDPAGNLYVADPGNQTVRKITQTGVVTTLAGRANEIGSLDGSGNEVFFNGPVGVAVDGAGNLYVADAGNSTIRKGVPRSGPLVIEAQPRTQTVSIGTNAAIFVVATGTAPLSYQWQFNGTNLANATNSSVLLTNVLLRKAGGYSVVITSPSGSITSAVASLRVETYYYAFTTLAETGGTPIGTAVDSAGNVYVADSYNHTIRKITPAGVVSTLAGLAGSYGSENGTGSEARFYEPYGVALDSFANVYVADSRNHTIRKITPAGKVSTFAGRAGESGDEDGNGTSNARFYYPQGVAVDAAGNVYVTQRNHTIRIITPARVVNTLAGVPNEQGSDDGFGNQAGFYDPRGIAVDGAGNLYVADSGNHTIRKITPDGEVSTIAGVAEQVGSVDGKGSAARFRNPQGVAVDSAGNVYVTDTQNHTIRKVSATGVVRTLAGLAGSWGGTDGAGSAARFYFPLGMAVDSAGSLYVGHRGSGGTIRKGVPYEGQPVLLAQPRSGVVSAGGTMTFLYG